MKRIAVLGAGLAGLVVATELGQHAEVTVFEKSRGVGGRMATRRAGAYQFDHGAQFFTARGAEFAAFVERLATEGVVDTWHARFVEIDRGSVPAARQWGADPQHFVAVPGMNALAKRLAHGVDVRLRAAVAGLRRDRRGWRLHDDSGVELGTFDWVVSTLPAPQAIALLPIDFASADALRAAQMVGCFSLLLGFGRAPALDWDAALVRNADVSWISVDSSKPGRGGGFSLVVQSTNAWAEAHMDDDPRLVEQHLLRELHDVTGSDPRAADYRSLHRWRYANADKRDADTALVDAERGLAACGDWCIRGRVEAAFSSAQALARRVAALL